MPLEIVRNDITKMTVDAIVNAAKESLLGGGGVDGCIHRAAGPELLAECQTLGGCKNGDAKITKAYRLPCKYVIHTVGPVWNGGKYGEREQMVSCYRTSLALAKAHKCKTVAFPLISSGIFGYPKDQALRVAVDTIGEFLMENDMTVYIVIFERAAYQISGKLFADIAEYIDDHYVDEHTDSRRERLHRLNRLESKAMVREDADSDFMAAPCAPMAMNVVGDSLDDMLDELDAGFSETLLTLIDRTGKKDSDIYKKANVDRKLFSKIRNNPDYKPSKTTAIAFAIALELDLEETKDFIARASFALSRSSKFDVIIEYFIKQKRLLRNSKRKSKPRQRQRKKKKQFRQQKHPWKSPLNQSLRPAKYPQLTRSIRHQNRKWPQKQHRNLHPSRLTSYPQFNPRRWAIWAMWRASAG